MSLLEQARKALDAYDTQTAEALLGQLIKSEPKNATAYAELGLALCYGQREFEAVSLLDRAKTGERYHQLAQLLANHFECRKKMALKIGANDTRGREALVKLKSHAKPDEVGIRLTACLIVKNEEANIKRCLKSLEGVADETVVVDTGSTDRTVEIAQEFGAKLGHYDWTNDFSAARNESLKLATGDWILWIDADEELEVNSHAALREGLIRPHFGGYFIQIINFMSDEGEANRYVHTPVRLFKRFEGLKFEGRIHEQVLPSIREAGLVCASLNNVTLNHYGYMPDAMVEKDKLNRTISMLEREVEESPDDAFQLFNLANAYSVGKMPKMAAQTAFKAIQKLDNDAPYGPVTYQILASALTALGLPEEALKVCEEAEERGFGAITVAFERAHAFYRQREFHLALIAINRCMEMDWPEGLTGDFGIKTHKSQVLKAQILCAMGQMSEAESLIEQALAIEPSFLLATFAKAFIRERQGRLDESEDLFLITANDPDLREPSLKVLGHIAKTKGQNDLAAERFETAWREFPKATDAWSEWVAILESAGKSESAQRAYEEMESLSPLNSDLLINWGRLIESTNPEEAQEKFKIAIDRDPANANAHFNLGDSLYRQQQFLAAATAYQAGLSCNHAHAPGWFVLGNALAMMNLTDGAKVAYEQALRIDPTLDEAEQNLQSLAA